MFGSSEEDVSLRLTKEEPFHCQGDSKRKVKKPPNTPRDTVEEGYWRQCRRPNVHSYKLRSHYETPVTTLVKADVDSVTNEKGEDLGCLGYLVNSPA